MTATTTRSKAAPKASAKPAGNYRLTLTIDGVDYDVRPFKPTKPGTLATFLLSRPGAPPRWIAQTREGQKCTCEDFQFRHAADGPKGGCKHLKAARAVGIL